jgi:hypothetical protein
VNRRFVPLASLAALVLSSACGGAGPKVRDLTQKDAHLAPALANAFRTEATGDPSKAIDAYLAVVETAAETPRDPSSVTVASAALDALVHRSMAAFADASSSSSLADRVPGAASKIDARLAKIEAHADGPFVAGLVAEARLALAERRGDARAAQDFRALTGCAREATLFGPLSWAPITGVAEPGPFDRADAPVPAHLAGTGPFAAPITPAKVAAFGCLLPLHAETSSPGVRDVVVDVDVPQDGWVGVSMTTPSAAVLHAGGLVAMTRPHAAGYGNIVRFAEVEATPGVLRLDLRVGLDQDTEHVMLQVWGADGKPLTTHAPAAGQRATSTAKRVVAAEPRTPHTDDESLAVALGSLANADTLRAEGLLGPLVAKTDAKPELLLAYARAVWGVHDLPTVKAHDRARAAFERVLEAWPSSWEAAVSHAVLAGARRGQGEARIESLLDLEKTRAKAKSAAPELLDAYEAITAGYENLHDRATAAYERANKGLAGTPLAREVERVAFDRTGREAAAFACDPKAPSSKTSLACQRALFSIGDRAGAEKELERLRVLSGAPQLYLSLSSHDAVEVGDLGRAAKDYQQMNPGDRELSTLYAIKGKSSVPELYQLAVVARDAPMALPGLLRASGDDPLKAFAGVAERVTAMGAGPIVANAATAILAHDERYTIAPNGLVHFVMLDVRRVVGTTDVEANAQASSPMLYGRDTTRVLRRRIFKKDGRILLPEQTPHAAQSHADLAQLEAGDAVEAIYEGFAAPGPIGNVGVDTPDLFPERTAVRDARIEVRMPASLHVSMWSHPLLGKPEETTVQGDRVLVWHLEDRPVRRLESGVPKMDRSAGVSFSTTTWADVARGQREAVAALESDSPEVTKWALEASGQTKPDGTIEMLPDATLVDHVVTASGQAVKEASGIVLADVDVGRIGGHFQSARNVLATHEGSRTWLVTRALRELGIPTDIVVAENEPFSDSPTFPPHFGRFMHPLAVAHLRGTPGPKGHPARDVWIDADVPGPPLPAGKISPELRGRMALYPDGKIAPLPAFAADAERDEIDERLTVDDQGNAKGSLTVLLRGRSAQDLAEALVRLVGLERQRALRGIALGWVPFATVEKVELSSSEGSWQVAIRAELTAPAYAQIEGTKAGARTWVLPGIDPIHYVFPRPYVTTLGSTYASHGARENALAINHATQYHVRRRVDLPPKAAIARLPGAFDGKGPLLAAKRTISVAGSTIEEDFTLDVNTGTVARDKYDDFVTQAHRADDAFRASIQVKPPLP